jgi:hypothetical protein
MTRRALLILVAAASGCLRANGAFHCATDTDCVRGGAAGTCEPVGLCSFADATCPNGSRFGELAGSLSNQCVGANDGGIDTPLVDGARDATATDAPPGMPMFVGAEHFNTSTVSQFSYPITIPAGTKRALVVSVQIADQNCSGGTTPTVTSVKYANASLTQLATILGTGGCATDTRSEQWLITNPMTGTHNIDVQLSATSATSVHSGAIWFTGVNPATPVRASATASGTGTGSTVDVASAPNDLVVNTVGEGRMIVQPLTGTLAFLNNQSGGDTLDNSAASYAPGASPTVTMEWQFSPMVDEWQTISSSLRP